MNNNFITVKTDVKNKILVKAFLEADITSLLDLPGARFNIALNKVILPLYSLPLFVKRFKDRVFADASFTELYAKQKEHDDLIEEIKKIENSGRKDKEWLISLGLDVKDIELAYDHQRVLLDFFINSGGRILIGDEMGLGKGLESILISEYLKKYEGIKRVLIICPNSIKYSVWQKEIKRWSNEKSTVIDGDKQEKIDLVANCSSFFLVTNYEALQLRTKKIREGKKVVGKMPPDKRLLQAFLDWKPDLVIIDEAHAIKTAASKQTKAIKMLNSPYRILMSGTPILNKTNEIWSLLNYLRPDLWYGYGRFTQTFCNFEEVSIFDRSIMARRNIKTISGYKNMDLLKQSIAPIFIRREKSEVMKDLPERIYEDREIALSKEQVARYNELVLNFKTQVGNKEVTITKQLLIVQLTKLLQVCDTLACFDPEHDVSSKLDELETIVEENIEKHKIVVFTWFKETAKAIEKRLLVKNISSVVRIDGDVPLEVRADVVEKFQDKEHPRVLVATISTCGLGLTLTAADICIFVSRSYVPALNDQAEARLHRPGQKNAVSVINLYAQGTVEDKVRIILEEKKELFRTFTEKELENLVVEKV
jgi:SNF2 family DNA or RNA helicase